MIVARVSGKRVGQDGKDAGGKLGKKTSSADGSDNMGDPVGSSQEPRIRPKPDPRLSRSLEYGVAILECFGGARQMLGIAELADFVGTSRSTTHRYAVTLVALGYLEQGAERRYRLSRGSADPGMAAIGAIRRDLSAAAVLEGLRDELGYTVSMGTLDRACVTYVYRLFGHRLGQYAIDRDLAAGASVPAYCTALGKVLLANLPLAERDELLEGLHLVPQGPKSITTMRELAGELDRVRARDAVVSDEELVLGGRSIATLVERPSGEHPLAIEVSVPSEAYTVNQLAKKVGPRLKRAARLLSGE
jgi:IclR family pca regulon transcriptional regulator